MKKLREIRQEMQDLENLIGQMKSELDFYRILSYRYFLDYGKVLDKKNIEMADSIQAIINVVDDMGIIKCDFVDLDKIGMRSNYKRITDKINQ
jgi:hypothetical protein